MKFALPSLSPPPPPPPPPPPLLLPPPLHLHSPSYHLSLRMKTTWKDIAPVPTSQEFLDSVLSRTQRRLPTQIRAGFKISRIRSKEKNFYSILIPIFTNDHCADFYTRKVKYTQETFSEKLTAILDGFPRLQDIHPFRKSLLPYSWPFVPRCGFKMANFT